MPEILIPLIGVIDFGSLSAVCMVVGTVLKRDAKLDDELWEMLIIEKVRGRYRNLNDVIRVKFGLQPLSPFVKTYSDEGDPVVVNT